MSSRYKVVGRTALGVVLILLLCVSDMPYTSRMVWYRGLTSCMCRSGIRCLWRWWLCINNCLEGSNIVGLEICFKSFTVSVSVPYSWLLLRIWSAEVDCGSLCFMYWVRSLYRCCMVRLVSPMYEMLQVSLYMLLLSFSVLCLCGMCCSICCMVFVVLYVICKFVHLN